MNKIHHDINTTEPIQTALHDHGCERQVLSTLLSEAAYYQETLPLHEELFDHSEYRKVFTVIRRMRDEGLDIDRQGVRHQALAYGIAIDDDTLREIMLENPTYEIEQSIATLRDYHARRQLEAASDMARELSRATAEKMLGGVRRIIDYLDRLGEQSLAKVKGIGEVTRLIVARLGQPRQKTYSRTGFDVIDRNGMLRPQMLTVLAARSSHGKTAMALSIAYNVAKAGDPVAYYSLEMSDEELTSRMAARLCDVEARRVVMADNLTAAERGRIGKAMDDIATLPIYFDDTATITPDALLQSVRQMARAKKVAGVFVDYLQILVQTNRQKNQTEESALGNIVRQLKNVAKQEGIWIVLLSQLNRNHDQDEPSESDLRGSGQILETADNCLMLWRPEKAGKAYRGQFADVSTSNTAQLRVVKARMGDDKLCDVVGFVPSRAHFYQPNELPKASEKSKKSMAIDRNTKTT